MDYIYSVEEATQKLYTGLAETTGWKYLKSRRCLKKPVEDLVFEINFYSSKWNLSHQSVEVNAGFSLRCKSYGQIAYLSYTPKDSYWYDISTEEKLNSVFEEMNNDIQKTAVELSVQFENDYLMATESLLKEYFEEYNVYLDFIADKLGISAVEDKAQEIYDALSDEMKRQVTEYKNGIRSSSWMINRSNLKYIVDNDLIASI